MKKLTIAITLIFLLLLAALPTQASLGGYEINRYNVTINVRTDNSYEVQEEILVNFLEPRHGIYRNIPVRGTIQREDGTSGKIRAKVEDVRISEENFEVIHAAGDVSIKIGSEYQTLLGNHLYKINYRYIVGKDTLKNADEFYYNIIGSEWDVPIKNISFVINMPKAFDAKKVGFAWGTVGTSVNTRPDGATRVYGLRIIGEHSGLLPGEALTIRIPLLEGYFEVPIDYTYLWCIFLGVVLCAICGGIWAIYGDDDKVVEVINFEPPENMNSLELAFKYYGDVKANQVMSLLIYLANAGYLKIIDTGLETEKIRIQKLQEYDGSNKAERSFFNGLFCSGNEVEIASLKSYFYRIIQTISIEQKSPENKAEIIEPKSSLMQKVSGVLIAVYTLYFFQFIGLMYIGILAALCLMIKVLKRTLIGLNNSVLKGIAAIPFFLRVIRIIVCLIYTICGYSMLEKISDKPLIGLLFVTVSTFFAAITTCRTKYGCKIKGEIAGFKRFIETTEKHRFQELLATNPQYFYKLLPYAAVLGIEKKYMNKFGELCQNPDWYDTGCTRTNVFDYQAMNRLTTAGQIVSFDPTRNQRSKSSFSGGGISGGGVGGGGGGSW